MSMVAFEVRQSAVLRKWDYLLRSSSRRVGRAQFESFVDQSVLDKIVQIETSHECQNAPYHLPTTTKPRPTVKPVVEDDAQ